MESLYQQIIIDHYHNPRNRGTLVHASFSSKLHNPSCGDSILWQGNVTAAVIKEVAFEGSGCVISQATASLLSQAIVNKSLDEIKQLDTAFIYSLIGMSLGPVRLKCALLSLEALQEGVKAYSQEISLNSV